MANDQLFSYQLPRGPSNGLVRRIGLVVPWLKGSTKLTFLSAYDVAGRSSDWNAPAEAAL